MSNRCSITLVAVCRAAVVTASCCLFIPTVVHGQDAGVQSASKEAESYRATILASQPVAYWSFDASTSLADTGRFESDVSGSVDLRQGPRPVEFPLFAKTNRALNLQAKTGYVRVRDPGKESSLDFDAGDTITIEAWVAPRELPKGGFAYVVGKGRTYLDGKRENHNWAVRLKRVNGSAALTFLFRSRDEKGTGKQGEYHRWTSKRTFATGDGWHHVVLGYTFGEAKSLTGFIDGKPTKGTWDLGGATSKSPVVDDDEVWIGSSMGGSKNSTFVGKIDELAVYRHSLSAEEIVDRYRYNAPEPTPVKVPAGQVLVQIFEGVPDGPSWDFRPPRFAESFVTDTLALPELPKRYSDRGIQVDRPTPFLMRAYADIEVPKGKRRLLVRSREAVRVFLDGELIGETPFYDITVEANGPIWELDRSHGPQILPLQRGDRQAVIYLEGDGKRHRLRFDTLVGLNKRRPELGDTVVGMGSEVGDFTVVSFEQPFPLTERGWSEFKERNRHKLMEWNARRRRESGAKESEYWSWRHKLAREWMLETRPEYYDHTQTVDGFFPTAEEASSDQPTKIDDLEFLRRVALDLVGTIPAKAEIDDYLRDQGDRRQNAVERFLKSPGWADHWVAYWQDVLAENPNIINPSLNNTGPFRWWIHESFAENKPMDRFVTELIRMEGSQLFGGPAGFGLATENDVPMAAKAHILGQAFLGVQMQCARCHDAPSHDVKQRDLFSLAAMLKRDAVAVPKTSSIDLPIEEVQSMAVEVTLLPGEEVKPDWAFSDLMSARVPDGVLLSPSDSRERLAALITLPHNQRFARVIVNRLWQRLMGHGLVEPVHDWEGNDPTHPELLQWLADAFVDSGYDLQHVTRLIVNSNIYARKANDQLVAGPKKRKLTAEQLVDSLFVFSGKDFQAGEMSLDIDGARPAKLSLHLGVPRRAWMFSATSNERDRPSLDLPFAQPFVAFMEQFGWRGARQGPIHDRPDELTAGQPAEFANGVLVRRATRISPDHHLAEVASKSDLTVNGLVDELYLRVLTRLPTLREREIVRHVLQPGFEQRRLPDRALPQTPRDRRGTVSWSVHLEEEASEIKSELQRVVELGDVPTTRLSEEWRERLEDVIWSLLNSPEFRFSP